MNPVFVDGLGFWSPGFPCIAALLDGVVPPTSSDPSARLLPPQQRRRASAMARMAAEIASQAAEDAGADMRALPVVMGSAYGEIRCALDMMRSFGGDIGLPSPTLFHNSVHNTAAAYLSMATGNRSFSTTVAAGLETPAMALLESLAFLGCRRGRVLLLLLDEPVPLPFALDPPYPPAGVGLVLASDRGPAAKMSIAVPRRSPGTLPRLPAPLAGHPIAGGIALAMAVARRQSGDVALGPPGNGWAIEVRDLVE